MRARDSIFLSPLEATFAARRKSEVRTVSGREVVRNLREVDPIPGAAGPPPGSPKPQASQPQQGSILDTVIALVAAVAFASLGYFGSVWWMGGH
jgi:hypothetical protein